MTFAAMSSGVGIANDLQSAWSTGSGRCPIARSAFLVGPDGERQHPALDPGPAPGRRRHRHRVPVPQRRRSVPSGWWSWWSCSASPSPPSPAWVGLAVGDPETVQAAVFIPILPLVFTSSAFAPVSRLPGWMQPVARANPVTAAIDTARGLALGRPASCSSSATPTCSTAALHFILWWVGHRRRLHRARGSPLPHRLTRRTVPATARSGIKTRFGGFDRDKVALNDGIGPGPPCAGQPEGVADRS